MKNIISAPSNEKNLPLFASFSKFICYQHSNSVNKTAQRRPTSSSAILTQISHSHPLHPTNTQFVTFFMSV